MIGTEEAAGSRQLITRLFDHHGEAMSAVRYASVPRLHRPDALTQLTSPLAAAYQSGAKVFALWQHHRRGPFTVHVGGSHGFPSISGQDARTPGRILFPPGAQGSSVGDAAEGLGASLASTPSWVRLGAVLDPAAAMAGDHMETLEDHAPFLSATTFCLLSIAVPVAADHVEQEQARLRRMLHGESERLEAEWGGMARQRWQAQLEQHTAALTAGLWRIHLLCGADTPAEAAQVAALWASVARGPGPEAYRLAPASAPGSLQEAVSSTLTAQDPFSLSAPFVAGSATLATVCRPPLDEIPGIQARTTNPFDVATPGVGEIEFGQVLDVAKSAVGPMRVPLSSLGKHTFVHGATGAGKSQATRHLLTEFSKLGIPWVVLEPAKQEYADGMHQRLTDLGEKIPDPELRSVHVIRPGDPHATPVGLNPLQPEEGFPYQPHLDTLVDLMVAAFDADSPFPEVLAQGIMTAVKDAGWDPALSRPIRAVEQLYADGERPAYPDVADLVRACHEVIDAKGYGREVAGNVHGFVDMRLATLTTGTKRAAFTSGYPLSLSKVLRHNVVLELQDLGSDADRALYMGLFLARLSQAVRVRHGADPQEGVVRNVVVVEEAHRLLRNPEGLEGASARAVESFTDLLAEVRSQGVALIIAEQIPRKIAPDAVKNTAVKCMGRTPAQDDRDFVGAAVGLTDEQSREVVSLPPGVFAVHTDEDDRPVLVQFPYVEERTRGAASDPAALVDSLPSAFGSSAAAGAANQQDVAWAAQALGHPPLVTLCELVLLAHLMHEPLPVIKPELLRTVLPSLDVKADRAALDVTIGSASLSGVKARSGVLGEYRPEALAEVVAATIRDRLHGGLGGLPDPKWRSRFHRDNFVSRQLDDRDPNTPPHPDTPTWASWGMLHLDGRTSGEQRIALRRSATYRGHDRRIVLLGARRPGALESAVATTGYDFEGGLRILTRFIANRADIKFITDQLVQAATPRKGGSRE
ncbi:MAG: hypothetical protein WA994_00985 [Ornithinimicrobium sp.]